MLVPVADIILLTLLVLFFGLEQRRRTELYFRFWLAGWVMVLFSVIFWAFPLNLLVGKRLQECLWQDASACGGVAFLFSFMVSDRRWRVPSQCAVAVAVPVCLCVDLIAVGVTSRAALLPLVAIGEALSLWIAFRFLRRANNWLLPAVAAVCITCGGCMTLVVIRGSSLEDLEKLVMFQMFAVCGLLFARSKFAGGRFIGAVGFFAWGSFQILDTALLGKPWLKLAIDSIWTIPKYLVGMGMLLKIFEGAKREIAELGERQRSLYEEYRLLFVGNPHPMWIYDVQTTRFLAVNAAAVGAYGYSVEQFLAMSVREIESGERNALADFGRRTTKQVSRHRRANGTAFDVDVTDHDMVFEQRAARFVLAMDITEREELHRELVRQAQHDVLTGLPNRSMLDDRIEQCLSRCMREDRKGAVLTVDIDHFKRVNDTYGHLIGDDCLKAVASRLSSRVRQVDTIARTGGEEFTIVIGSIANRAAAETVCSMMLHLFDTPVMCGDNELWVTVSIGVALFPDHAIDIEGLRRRSDQALYEAKRLGRNRAVFASTVTV